MELAWLDFAAALIERVEDKYGRAVAWALAIVLCAVPFIIILAALWWAFS